MTIQNFINDIKTNPLAIAFSDVMALIDDNYTFTPVKFKNGEIINEAGINNGSCKLFSFAKMHHLTQQETLNCFGAYYRENVLLHPQETNHANIRNFIKTGWDGIIFDAPALTLK
jgi:hypothetical protein